MRNEISFHNTVTDKQISNSNGQKCPNLRVDMKLFVFAFLLFIGVHIESPCYSYCNSDSIGVTIKAGNNFIIHKVVAGETLYSISRKYAVSVQSIKEANDGISEALKTGQTIMIPMVKAQPVDGTKTHIVRQSETLYSVSRQYSVSVADLRKWNNLTDDNLSVGQKLVIKTQGSIAGPPVQTQYNTAALESASGRKTHTVAASQTLYSISRTYNVSTDELKSWNNLDGTSLRVGQVLIVSVPGQASTPTQESNSSMLPPSSTKATETSIAEVNNTKPLPAETSEAIEEAGEKIIQKGMAELVQNPTDTKKYLAFHRDAPVGTIMQVRNEMNNQTVFVRIVGTIPPTGDNAKVILQVSKKAYDRLGAVDSRFPVEVSYLP